MGVVDGDLAPDLDDQDLDLCFEKIKIEYEDRLKNVLTHIKTELERFSWFCSKIYELEDGTYAIGVSRDASHLTRDGDPDEQDVEIIARLMNSKQWDGTRGGLSFNVDVTSFGGESVGGLTPFNWTEDVWVPAIDEDKVEARMQLIEKADPYSMVKLLQKWLKGKAAR